jgi:hypothetical protein
MPKKSKKEKILADIRRRAHTEQSLTAHIPSLVKEETSPTFRFQVKKEATTPARKHIQENTTELTAIKRDLYKTFILATMAIAAEVIIYWFSKR